MIESDLNYWKVALNEVVPKELITPEVVALRDQQNKMLNLMAKRMLIMIMLSIRVVIN